MIRKLSPFNLIPGELERIFLVLREKVALRRLKERDGVPSTSSGGAGTVEPGPSQPVPDPIPMPPGAPSNVPTDTARRGEKRLASEGSLSPSKRPAH